jgi:hypothetical protein
MRILQIKRSGPSNPKRNPTQGRKLDQAIELQKML